MKTQGAKSFVFVLLSLFPVALRAQSLAPIFERVKPSVVVVSTVQKEIVPSAPGQTQFSPGLGSGVLISRDGKVLTAAHVAQAADRIAVEFADGEVIEARVLSSLPAADIALLQLAHPPAQPVTAPLGDSDQARVGDQVFVVGAPLGISYTLTVGHVSGRRAAGVMYDDFSLGEFLQTDAAINPGNSGGPMFNMNGEVLGIVSHVLSESGGWDGLGFAVASNVARKLLLDRRPFWSGIEGYLLKGDLAGIFNLPQPMGILVQRVAENSPGAQLGLRGGTLEAVVADQSILVGGDIILRVEDIPVSDANLLAIREKLAGLSPGSAVTIIVLRGGGQVKLTAVVPRP
jgi:S1-C subfamily serine protease